MSIIVKAGSEISKALTNTSTAKFQYTFSKASRFPPPNYAEELRKKKIQSRLDKSGENNSTPIETREDKYHFYSLPSTLSNRKTTFGWGKKSDFTKGGGCCQKPFYSTYSDFDQKNPHGPKYSFTKAPRNGKSQIKKKKSDDNNNEENKKEEKESTGPGPADYYYLKKFGADAPKYSMKGRHDSPFKSKAPNAEENTEEKKEEKPYLTKVTIQIRNSGKYFVSQIPNVNSLKFDKDFSKRSQFITNKNPAPNKYSLEQLLGRVYESQYKSYEPWTFARKYKVKDSRSNYPGPGSYIMPSDFGIYQSKDADKYPKDNVFVEPKKDFEDKPWRNNMKKIVPKKEKKEEEYNYNDYNNNNHNYSDKKDDSLPIDNNKNDSVKNDSFNKEDNKITSNYKKTEEKKSNKEEKKGNNEEKKSNNEEKNSNKEEKKSNNEEKKSNKEEKKSNNEEKKSNKEEKKSNREELKSNKEEKKSNKEEDKKSNVSLLRNKLVYKKGEGSS